MRLSRNGVIAKGGAQELYRKGNATTLSYSLSGVVGASVGNYALFSGGNTTGSTYPKTGVYSYDINLVKGLPTELSVTRAGHVGVSIGVNNKLYVLYAGGTNTAGTTYATIDAYNTSLTRSNPANLTAACDSFAGSGSVGNYAIVLGNSVDAYNSSLVHSNPSITGSGFGANVGDYVIFGDGVGQASAYNSSLVKVGALNFSAADCSFKVGASNGRYAVFGGATYYDSEEMQNYFTTVVNAFNASLVRTTPTALSRIESLYRYPLSLNSFALFSGPSEGSGANDEDYIEAYDRRLVKTIPDPFGNFRYLGSSSYGFATIGKKYALYAGGKTGSGTFTSGVEVYAIK